MFPARPDRRSLLIPLAAVLALPLAGSGRALAGHDTPKEGPREEGNGTARAAPFGTLDAASAYEKAKDGEIILVDIRTPPEWAETGVGEGALAINMRDPEFVKALVVLRQRNPETPIALICRTGNRSGYVVKTLAAQGFPGLVDVSEGMAGSKAGPGWLKRGLPTYPGTKDEIVRRLKAAFSQGSEG